MRAAARLLGPAEAEDAVQDAYIRALEASPQALGAVQAWLLTVVRHLAIDRLRRRQWLQQWQAQAVAADGGSPLAAAAPSAEYDAALAHGVDRALRLLAACLSPAEGAAVLLHEVFEATHADLAEASGKAEAACRQRVRRALQKLRHHRETHGPGADPDLAPSQEAALRVYLQSLQLRDAGALWGMLRHPPVSAAAQASATAAMAAAARSAASATAPSATCGVVQVGGQLGLVLTLDGVALCVLPRGARAPACDAEAAVLLHRRAEAPCPTIAPGRPASGVRRPARVPGVGAEGALTARLPVPRWPPSGA